MSTSGQSVEQANDFMALEVPLLELIRTAVAGLSPAVHVLSASELADVLESAQAVPAVHLIYGGFSPVEDVGTAVRLAHRWHVVAAVRNKAQIKQGGPARLAAGALLARVVGRLLATSIPGSVSPVKLVTPPPPKYIGGFQYLPATLSVETIFRKT